MINKCTHTDKQMLDMPKSQPIQPGFMSIQVHRINTLIPLWLLIALLIVVSCQSDTKQNAAVPTTTFNEDGSINAYIEIPAGGNIKYEYDSTKKALEPDQVDNKDRVIDFLPYLGNYGFITATKMDTAEGGDGDALDVLVLSESVDKGTVMRVLPIAVILLEDQGQKDHKVIAVPFDPSQRTINVEKFSTFITRYNAAQFIVQEWFLNYKGVGKMKLLGWKDEQFALKEIKRWTK